MPIQIQDIHEQEDIPDCPLCMEILEVDDINFFPCQCGYQICRFCWHRIRTDENGLCPACRKPYPENPAEFKPLTEQELQKIRLDKKQKEVARKQKITDSRKHLANVRVLQKNLVFVVGLSQRLADIEILKRQEYFGKYGKILKVVLNSNTSYAGTQAPSCSAYVTYSKMEESLRAIQSVNNVHIDGRTLKASLGTTKYCSNYLKNQQCMKHDCMYLHEIGDEDASFTKEDMQMAKHQEYEQRLIQQMIQKEISLQQELRSKSLRQEELENVESSSGSPPCTAVVQGMSVKRNAKAAIESSRPRRHSSGTSSAGETIATEPYSSSLKNSNGKSSRLCGTGEHDMGTKSEKSKWSSRRGVKKGSNMPTGSQAPRHKKQLQQQQANVNKNTRPQSASPSTQNSQSGSGSEQSPSSLPVSVGNSVESSPASTPLRDIVSDSSKLSCEQKTPDVPVSAMSKVSLEFAEESSGFPPRDPSVFDRFEWRMTSPIDIPAASQSVDKNREEPQSNGSSSVGKNSPFVKESASNNGWHHQNVFTNSHFSTLKESQGTQNPITSTAQSPNDEGGAPLGAISQTATSQLLNDIAPSNRLMPPPGLTMVPQANMGGWPAPNTHLSDTMPIKSSNDWEAAFGFKPTSTREVLSSVEDDFGFDPWAECNKGFAEMEKELQSLEGNSGRSVPSSISSQFAPNTRVSSAQFSGMPRTGPATWQGPGVSSLPQPEFSGGSNMMNNFSNVITGDLQNNEQKMPYAYDMKPQLERSRFFQSQQQRLTNHGLSGLPHEKSLQHLLGSVSRQEQHGVLNVGTSTALTDESAGQSSKHDMQEWQNGLRALLPSVNINFAMQSQNTQRQSPRTDSSLGLTGLGMPKPTKGSVPPNHPGVAHTPNQQLFTNKTHVLPPPGVGFPSRSPFMPSKQWSAPPALMHPGLPSARLSSPNALQSLFTSLSHAESLSPNYSVDPAIISSGYPSAMSTRRRARLFEQPQNGNMPGTNLNNNSNEEQPHWMKSLQALTEPDNPSHTQQGGPGVSRLPSQHPLNMSSWPSMPHNSNPFSASLFGSSQPPPGFQVRSSLSKPTEFGMSHNLLENQS